MHILGGKWWLGAALALLLGLSSPPAWLLQSPPRAMACCCPPASENVLCAPCCHVQSAPAPLAVAIVAPERAHFAKSHPGSTPAILSFSAAPRFSGAPLTFPIEVASPPPRAATVRVGSCRAPPSNGGNFTTI